MDWEFRGVAKSRTGLSNFHFSWAFHMRIYRRQLEKQVWSSGERNDPELAMICFGKCTVYHWGIKSKHFFLPVLLRHDWHTAPCKSRCTALWSDLHTSGNDYHRKLVNLHLRYKIKEKKQFFLDENSHDLLWTTFIYSIPPCCVHHGVHYVSCTYLSYNQKLVPFACLCAVTTRLW